MYIYTDWKSGQIKTHGIRQEEFSTPEEYFNHQIWKAFEQNVNNQTLPCFNMEQTNPARELTSGKIISGRNQIALEQDMAANSYKSNIYISGHDLARLEKELGISVVFKKHTMPVLCETFYNNAEFVKNRDTYINENGSTKNYQYMYNFDSLSQNTQKYVQKHLMKNQVLDNDFAKKNAENFRYNLTIDKNSSDYQKLENAKKIMNKYSVTPEADFSLLVNAHTRTQIMNMVGNTNRRFDEKEKSDVYKTYKEMVDNIRNNDNAKRPHEMGELLCAALNAGNNYAATFCAKNFDKSFEKTQEENQQKKINQERVRGRPSWER